MFKSGTRILMIGAHPDDIELGCGGTLVKLCTGSDIRCLVLSDRMDTGSPRNVREMYGSLEVLGIPADAVQVAHFPTRAFTGYRREIRETLLAARRLLLPEIVFCPSAQDLHQDHQVVYEEVRRIFRNQSLLGYEIIRSSIDFQPHLYFCLEEIHLSKKIAALQNYLSQTAGQQSALYYFQPQVIEAWASFRGAQIEVPLAEAFEVYCLRF